MLNISDNRITDRFDTGKYKTLTLVESKKSRRVMIRLMYAVLLVLFLIMFLPWTQNIRTQGTVSTLLPEQRPQTIHSIIPGRVEAWYVREGDFVKKGDTILKLAEMKDQYFDPELLSRTKNQIDLKENSLDAYKEKLVAQLEQINSISSQRSLELEQARIRLEQARLRLQNDSIAYRAALINYQTAQIQYDRVDSLYQSGLKSRNELELKNLKLQETKAYETEAKNKWLNAKNELINLKLAISGIQQKFNAELSKLQSDRLSTLSTRLDAESDIAKMNNEYSNYIIRSGNYYLTAPQDGYITKVYRMGIGETIKEGDPVLSIMPAKYDLTAEIFVAPIDLPLLEVGQVIRLQFDGWPAIVFSGWPNVSYGTYSGRIYAIDQFISENGKFRVMVSPDPEKAPWPKALRYGGGVQALILLKNVPIGYEVWRKLNGFPPDYYKASEQDASMDKKK